MKKTLSFILCVVMLLGMMPAVAFAEGEGGSAVQETQPNLPEGYGQLYLDNGATTTLEVAAARGWRLTASDLYADGQLLDLNEFEFSVSDSKLGEMNFYGGELSLEAAAAIPGSSGWIYAVSKTEPSIKYALHVTISQPDFGVYTSDSINPDNPAENYVGANAKTQKYTISYTHTNRTIYLHLAEGISIIENSLTYPSDLLDYSLNENSGMMAFALKENITGLANTEISLQATGGHSYGYTFRIDFVPTPQEGYGQLYLDNGTTALVSTLAVSNINLVDLYANGNSIDVNEYNFSVSDNRLGVANAYNGKLYLNTRTATPGATGWLYAVSKADENIKYAIAVSIGRALVGAYTSSSINPNNLGENYVPWNNDYKCEVNYTETGRSVYLIPGTMRFNESGISVNNVNVTATLLEDGTLKVTLNESCTDARVAASVSFKLSNNQPFTATILFSDGSEDMSLYYMGQPQLSAYANEPQRYFSILLPDGSVPKGYTFSCDKNLGTVYWVDNLEYLVWDCRHIEAGQSGKIYAEKNGKRYSIEATVEPQMSTLIYNGEVYAPKVSMRGDYLPYYSLGEKTDSITFDIRFHEGYDAAQVLQYIVSQNNDFTIEQKILVGNDTIRITGTSQFGQPMIGFKGLLNGKAVQNMWVCNLTSAGNGNGGNAGNGGDITSTGISNCYVQISDEPVSERYFVSDKDVCTETPPYLAPLTINGNTYYMYAGTPGITYPVSYDGGAVGTTPSYGFGIAHAVSFFAKIGENEYQRVEGADALREIEKAIGDTLKLSILPYDNEREETTPPEVFPAVYGGDVRTEAGDAFPNSYDCKVFRLQDDNMGSYLFQASCVLNGVEIKCGTVETYLRTQNVLRIDLARSSTDTVLDEVYSALQNVPAGEYDKVEVTLPIGEIEGYIEIPEGFSAQTVGFWGAASGQLYELDNIKTTVRGGIINNSSATYAVSKIHFIGAGKDKDFWPEDSVNAGKPNQMRFADTYGNIIGCIIEGYDVAISSYHTSMFMHHNELINNGTAVLIDAERINSVLGQLRDNTFKGNDVAINFSRLPQNVALTNYNLSNNAFIDNGTDINNGIGRNIFMPGCYFGVTNESGEFEERECIYSPKAVGNAKKQVLYYPQATDTTFSDYIYDTSFYNHTGSQTSNQNPVVSVEFTKTFPIPAGYLDGATFDVMKGDTMLAKIGFIPQQQTFRMLRMTRAAVESFDATIEVEHSADGRTITVTTQPFPSGKTATISVPCDGSWTEAKVTAESGEELEAAVADGYISFTTAAGGTFVITNPAGGNSGGEPTLKPLYWRMKSNDNVNSNPITSNTLTQYVGGNVSLEFFFDEAGTQPVPRDVTFRIGPNFGMVAWNPDFECWMWDSNSALPGVSGSISLPVGDVVYFVPVQLKNEVPIGFFSTADGALSNYIPLQNGQLIFNYNDTVRSVYLIASGGQMITAKPDDFGPLSFSLNESRTVLTLTVASGFSGAFRGNFKVNLGSYDRYYSISINPALPDGYSQMLVGGPNGASSTMTVWAGNSGGLGELMVNDAFLTPADYNFILSSNTLGRVVQDASVNNGVPFLDAATAIPGASGWLFAEHKTDANTKYAIALSIFNAEVGVYSKPDSYQNNPSANYISPQNGIYTFEYSEGARSVYLIPNQWRSIGEIVGVDNANVTATKENGMIKLTLDANCSLSRVSAKVTFKISDTSNGNSSTPWERNVRVLFSDGSEDTSLYFNGGATIYGHSNEPRVFSGFSLPGGASLAGYTFSCSENLGEVYWNANNSRLIWDTTGVAAGQTGVISATNGEKTYSISAVVNPAFVSFEADDGPAKAVINQMDSVVSYEFNYNPAEGKTAYIRLNQDSPATFLNNTPEQSDNFSSGNANIHVAWQNEKTLKLTVEAGNSMNYGGGISAKIQDGQNQYRMNWIVAFISSGPMGPQVIPAETPYSIPYEVKAEHKYAGISGEDTHLAAFIIDGETYYMNAAGPFATFPETGAGMRPALAQGEYMDNAAAIGFYVKEGEGEYQRVVESATLDKIEAAFGNTLRLEFRPYENAQEDAFAPAVFPALYSATIENYMYDNSYCTSVMHMGLENRGWYIMRATGTINGVEIVAESSFFWDVRDAASQKTLDYSEWSGGDIPNIIPNLNYELANLEEQFTSVEIYLPAAELYGYIDVPADHRNVMVSIHGMMNGADVSSIATKLYGGIVSNNELVFVEKLSFIGAGKNNETWGMGANEGVANIAISGNGGTNADLCVFDGFDIAVNITGSGNKAVYRSILRNNGTAVCFDSTTLADGNNDFGNNRFERNDTAIHFAALPEEYPLTKLSISYDVFIDNGTDVRNDIKRNIFLPGNYFAGSDESGMAVIRECIYSPVATGNTKKQVLYYPQANDQMFSSYIFVTDFYNHTGSQTSNQNPVVSVEFTKTFPIPAGYLDGATFDVMKGDTMLAKIGFIPQQQTFRMLRMTRAAVESFDATVEVERSEDGKTITITTQVFPTGKTATISVPCDESWTEAKVTAESGEELEATVADGYISFTTAAGGSFVITENSPVLYSVSYEYTGEVPAGAPALPETVEYEAGASVTVAAAPTLEGYTFSGWNKTDFTMPGEDVVITGSWTAVVQPPADTPIMPSAPSVGSETVTQPDGSTTTTTSTADGSKGSTTVKPDGSVEAEAKLSASAVANAAAKGESVALPIPELSAGTDSESAPVITISTGSAQPVRVEIPVAEAESGTVAVLVLPDGSEKIVKNCAPTEAGVELEVPDGAVVKVIDNAAHFDDVHEAEHWGEEAINFASARELMQGVGGDSFSPDTTTTRGMVFTVLARYADHDTTADAGEHWHVPGTDWAMANGVSDGSDPDGTVTREQIITMLWRYAGSPAASGNYDSFVDADEVSDWASEAIRWAVSIGLIQGRGANDIAPKASATRAEFTQMLYKFCVG